MNKVSVGLSTIIGYVTGFAALLPTVAKSVEEGRVAWDGPEKYLAIAGIIFVAITKIGRYAQAVIAAKGQPVVDELAPGTSPVWATGPTAPDGIDSASLPHAS